MILRASPTPAIKEPGMPRRLLAVLSLALSLGACSERTPETPEPAPATPAPVSTAATPEYQATPSPTLQAVRARGYLTCGVHQGLPGFALRDVRGVWQGFDVDVCRAVAAAVLGDATKVRFTVIKNENRFGALKAGQIDILSRNTSWTLARDAGLGLDFAAVTYFDGQGFLAPRALNLTTADELNGARICVQTGTASANNLADYFRARGLNYTPVEAASEEEARNAYQAEKCDAYTADVSALAASRSVLNNPNAHAILPTVISKEPLGPVVRQDDAAWTGHRQVDGLRPGPGGGARGQFEDGRRVIRDRLRPAHPAASRARGRLWGALGSEEGLGLPGDQTSRVLR